MTITPAECIQCRLCENACPYDAIEKPVTVRNPEPRKFIVRRFMLVTLLIPFFMVLGGWTGALLHENLARVNGTVRMAEEVLDAKSSEGATESIEMTAFRASGKSTETLYREAADMLNQFYIGGWILGAFIGLSVGAMIAGMLLRRYRTDYEPHRGTCFSCARCVDYCPVKPEPTVHG